MLLMVTATEREMRAALKEICSAPPLRRGVPESVVLSGRSAGRDLALLVTGVGLLNAALHLGRCLHLPGLLGVLNVGVAGAFDTRRFPLGSPVLVERECWPEYGLERADGGADPRALGFALHEDGTGGKTWDRLDLDPDEQAARLGLSFSAALARGASVSVSTVTTTPGRAARLRHDYAADLENMEGFALAHACAVAGLPFAELRTVSNRVGSRKAEDWNLRGALAELGRAVAEALG